MTTDDAPRPALDAASFRALVDTLLDWHSAMSHAAFDGDAARTNACYARTYARMRDAYQRVLAAGRRADALAGEVARLRRAVVLALDGPSDGEIGMETTLGRLNRIERQLRAALSRQEGDDDGR